MARVRYIAYQPFVPWQIMEIAPDGTECIVELAATRAEAEDRARELDKEAEERSVAANPLPVPD